MTDPTPVRPDKTNGHSGTAEVKYTQPTVIDDDLQANLDLLRGNEQELSPSQREIRNLVYTGPGHFFGGHDLTSRKWDASDVGRDNEFLERVIVERELGASITNSIALNSSDDPAEQDRNSARIKGILEKCDLRLSKYTFRNGNYKVEDLAGDDASIKLFAKIYTATCITSPYDESRFFHQFHDVAFFIEKGYITPTEVVDIQNLVREEVIRIPEDKRPPQVDLVSVLKNLEVANSLKAERPNQPGNQLNSNSSRVLLESVQLDIVTPQIRKPFMVPGLTSDFDSFKGQLPEYAITGEATHKPEMAPTRVIESLEAINDFRNLVLAEKAEVPDFRAAIADKLRPRIQRTKEDTGVPLSPLKELSSKGRNGIFNTLSGIASDIDEIERDGRFIRKVLNLPKPGGILKRLDPDQEYFLETVLVDNSIAQLAIREAGLDPSEVKKRIIMQDDNGVKNQVRSKLEEFERRKIEELQGPPITALEEFESYSPLSLEPITAVLNKELGTIMTSHEDFFTRTVTTRETPIMEVTPHDLDTLVAAWTPIAQMYDEGASFAPKIIERFRDEHGIIFDPNTGQYIIRNQDGRTPSSGSQFLSEILNRLTEISRRGSTGLILAEALEEMRQTVVGKITAHEEKILQQVTKMFPERIAESMVQAIKGPQANRTTYAA